jgi:hypothetical protein
MTAISSSPIIFNSLFTSALTTYPDKEPKHMCLLTITRMVKSIPTMPPDMCHSHSPRVHHAMYQNPCRQWRPHTKSLPKKIGNQGNVRLVQSAPNILSRHLSNMLLKDRYASERTTPRPFDTAIIMIDHPHLSLSRHANEFITIQKNGLAPRAVLNRGVPGGSLLRHESDDVARHTMQPSAKKKNLATTATRTCH